MPIPAAGLLMYRNHNGNKEYFLIHPGGPFYSKKNEGFWSIPKGLPEKDETLLQTAQREFFEETGITATPPFFDLDTARTKGGKIIYAWAFRGNWNEQDGIISNTFEIAWPPRSGQLKSFPEADRASWFTLEQGLLMINVQQKDFLLRAHASLI